MTAVLRVVGLVMMAAGLIGCIQLWPEAPARILGASAYVLPISSAISGFVTAVVLLALAKIVDLAQWSADQIWEMRRNADGVRPPPGP